MVSTFQRHGNGHVRLRHGVHGAGDDGRLQRDLPGEAWAADCWSWGLQVYLATSQETGVTGFPWNSMDLKPRIDGNTGSLAAKMVDDLIGSDRYERNGNDCPMNFRTEIAKAFWLFCQ